MEHRVVAPPLARGYTRSGDYLFDSDDEAPVPKPHPANAFDCAVWTTPPPQLGCISPPPQVGCIRGVPPKQRSSSAEARSAGSAPIAKVAVKASMQRFPSEPKPPPTRPSTRVQASYDEPWAAATPGCISPAKTSKAQKSQTILKNVCCSPWISKIIFFKHVNPRV